MLQPTNIYEYKAIVKENAKRIKELGEWPEYIDEVKSLIDRVPNIGESSSGFDAGIACALDIIPRDKQKLSAILHAAYTPQAVQWARSEVKEITNHYSGLEWANIDEVMHYPETFNRISDLQTCWWLAACKICCEGDINSDSFISQIKLFKQYVYSPFLRLKAALFEINSMRSRYIVIDNIPIATRDGGLQACYIDGYPFGIGMAQGVWFVGTYFPSLGIPDNFIWNTGIDDHGRPLSGPVHGSKQFVKASNLTELSKVIDFAILKLGKKNAL